MTNGSESKCVFVCFVGNLYQWAWREQLEPGHKAQTLFHYFFTCTRQSPGLWEPTNVICNYVNVDEVVVLPRGGRDTSTQHAVIKLVSKFAFRSGGSTNLVQTHSVPFVSFAPFVPYRGWEHPNTILSYVNVHGSKV